VKLIPMRKAPRIAGYFLCLVALVAAWLMPRTAAIAFHVKHGAHIEVCGIRVPVPTWYLATAPLPNLVILFSGNHHIDTRIAISSYESDSRVMAGPRVSYDEFRASVMQNGRATTPPREREIASGVGRMKCFEYSDPDPKPIAWCTNDGALIVASFRGDAEQSSQFYEIVRGLARQEPLRTSPSPR
jgi:hypothetical protein